MQRRYDPSQVSKWLAPIVLTILVSTGVFFALYAVDILWISNDSPAGPQHLKHYWFLVSLKKEMMVAS